jgi:predicted double-glycine peptidase
MLKVLPFRQKPGYCGPASLKIVLGYYGVKKSEKSLVALSGCSMSNGVEAEYLLRAAKKLGLQGFIKDLAEINDLRLYVNEKKVPVIVDWFDGTDGHYSVVVGLDRENIYLQDPSLGHARALKLTTFRRVWFDFPGKFLMSKNDINIRRMIVIYK